MRIILILVAFLCVSPSSAQSYKVITVSPGVTVSGKAVTIGTILQHSFVYIEIPQGGSVGLVTHDGYVGTLYNKTLLSQVREFLTPLPDPKEKGTLINDKPLLFTLSPELTHSYMIGDSLFIFWVYNIATTPRPDYVAIIDMYGDKLYSTELKRDWVIVNISNVKGNEKQLLCEFRNKETKKPVYTQLIKIAEDKVRTKVLTELAPYKNDPDWLFYEAVVYELNFLYNDRSMPIYKILSGKKSATDPFLKAYYEKLYKDKYLKDFKPN